MKRRNLVLAILAVVLVLGMSVGTAWSYFTDTTTADGSMTISVKPEADLHEDPPVAGTKTLRIKNTSEMVPVWTRVRVYSAIGYKVDTEGTHWTPGAADGQDGTVYEYNTPLEAGQTTDDFKIYDLEFKIPYDAEHPDGVQNLEGYEENVVVVYECVPVSYNADGTAQSANWN